MDPDAVNREIYPQSPDFLWNEDYFGPAVVPAKGMEIEINGKNLAMYRDEINRFLESGGYLAWGIVPTTDAIGGETPESIINKFESRFKSLSKHIPKDTLLSQIILTPSCGTGSRSMEETIKIFQLLMRLKEALA